MPIIKNYLPKQYSANVQNWAIIQDKRGVLYFGNVSGLLEYDGVNWRLIKIPNDAVRCLAIDDDGKIFVGGIHQLGYLSPDSLGELKYVSLNKYIFGDKTEIGEVWRIIVHSDGLYFQTFSTLYLFEANKNKQQSFLERILKTPSLKRWESRSRINPIHSIGNRIFVHERNLGLQELRNGKLIMLPGGEEFAQDLICIMLPFPSSKLDYKNSTSKILIGSLRRGMFLFDGTKFEKFNNEADKYLIENRLYFRGALLSDGSYALGTQLGGIVVIDQKGKLKKIIDKNLGLNNNTIWDLFYDREGNLWSATDNGISKILYPSSLRIINEKSGFEGSIQTIKHFDNKIYLATSSGIYYLDNISAKSENGKFDAVKNISVQSWDLLQIKDKVLAATNDGVFEIKNNIASIIDHNYRYATCFFQSTGQQSLIYVGMNNGIAVLKNENDKISFIGMIADFNAGIISIEEDQNGFIWCNDVSGNIIALKTPTNKENLNGYKRLSISNSAALGQKAKLFKHLNKVYFFNNNQVFEFNNVDNKFIRSNILEGVYKDSTQMLINVFNDDRNIIWSITNQKGKILVTENDIKVKSNVSKTYSSFGLAGEDLLTDFISLKSIVSGDQTKTLWVSGGNILISYKLDSESDFSTSINYLPMIRKVSLNGNNILFNGYSNHKNNFEENPIEVDYSTNSVVFEYSLPSFLNESGNDYQFLLEGFDKQWSSWIKGTKKEYTNLPSGNFIFKVRGKNAEGKLSDISSFNFKILPPWYKTWWANFLGFLIVLLIINYVIRVRVRYLKNKNIVLERLVNDRTVKIKEQKDVLEKQAQKLMELDQLKSDFFANISHEFRTPLTLIKGQLENVLRIVKDENVKKKVNVAFTNSNRLNRLINQVLDLSKLESGKLQLEFEKNDIVALIKNRVSSFDSFAEQKNITVQFFSYTDCLFTNIDKEKIEEVIDNLLSNALKFTPAKGKIVITINAENIDFTENAVISISDNGVGISEEKISHIFDRFFQADNSSTKEYEGTGLGLAIVKELVELHGGTITVESKLNEGTTFFISLPVLESEENLGEKEIEKEHKPDSTDDFKEVVLIVEDNYDVRNYIKENLEHLYKIEEAVDGEDGILKAIEKTPDLIITDLMMPKVNGFELCNKIKNDQRTSHIPIIMLTAKVDEQSKLDGLQIGADEFLAKPFSSRELEIRVGNLIRIRQLLREKYKEISVIKSEDVNANSLDKEFLNKVFDLIRTHLEDDQFSVQKLADEIGMSVSQLNRKLNALINQSAGKLFRSTKLDYAAKLLKKNAGNITEIAYRIGFADVSSFTNSFKEKFGISPSEYLKNKNL
ncbi:MAG: ATP-binding protein [Ignavibacteriota bacterium]